MKRKEKLLSRKKQKTELLKKWKIEQEEKEAQIEKELADLKAAISEEKKRMLVEVKKNN